MKVALSLCMFFVALWIAAPLYADTVLPFRYLVVEDQGFGVAEVWSEAQRARFSEPVKLLNRGYDPKPLWLWVQLDPSEYELLTQTFWFIQRLDLYGIKEGKPELLHTNGSLMPLSQRPVPSMELLFPLQGQGKQDFLLYAHSDQMMLFQLRGWNWPGFLTYSNLERTLYALLFGAMAVVALYQLSLFAEVRDPLFVSYAVYIGVAGLILFTHSGLARELLWPESVWAPAWATGFGFFIGGAVLLWFARHLLRTARYLPKIDRWLFVYYFPLALVLLAPWIGPGDFEQLATAYLALGYLGTLSLALATYTKDRATVLRFVGGWIFLLVSGLLLMALTLKWVEYHPLLYYSVYYGALIELVFFSLAVGLRFGQMQRAGEAAQRALLKATRNHANELETRVAHRTVELQQANTQLEQLIQEQGEFLQIAAHDIKTPLNAIAGFSELFQDPKLDPKDRREYAAYILDSAHNLSDLVNNLLDVQKIEESTRNLRLGPVSADSVLEEALNRYQLMARGKGLELEVSGEPGLSIEAHREWLKEVLGNLLSNALKFSPKGSTVRVTAQAKGDWVVFSVSDQGPGISAKEQTRIFEKFGRGQAQATGGESSSGLGLYIVKKMTEAMGGQVALQSEPGAGATFSVSFRQKKAPDELGPQTGGSHIAP